jgi:protein involved in polysaccharide export with SLBB domain
MIGVRTMSNTNIDSPSAEKSSLNLKETRKNFFPACFKGLAVFLLCIGASACAQNDNYQPPSTASAPPAQGYKLGNGDQVHIIVFNQQSLTGDYTIDGAGQLAFPLIGAVKAGGLTGPQLEKEITQKLSPDYLKDPNVTVEVLKYRPFYIVGEVKNPGSYPYVDGMSVINAVALAGGFTYRAKEEDFYIRRNEDPGKRREEAHQGTPVYPGDVIIVRERYF